MKDCADHMHAQTTDQSAQRRIVGTAMLPVSTTRLFWGLLCEYGVLVQVLGEEDREGLQEQEARPSGENRYFLPLPPAHSCQRVRGHQKPHGVLRQLRTRHQKPSFCSC